MGQEVYNVQTLGVSLRAPLHFASGAGGACSNPIGNSHWIRSGSERLGSSRRRGNHSEYRHQYLAFYKDHQRRPLHPSLPGNRNVFHYDNQDGLRTVSCERSAYRVVSNRESRRHTQGRVNGHNDRGGRFERATADRHQRRFIRHQV